MRIIIHLREGKMIKIFASLFIAVYVVFSFTASDTAPQSRKTIILVRHAEKDTSENANSSDPSLTQQGEERAEQLVKAIKKIPSRSGLFNRFHPYPRDTAAPIAKRCGLRVKIYDGKNQNALVDEILKKQNEAICHPWTFKTQFRRSRICCSIKTCSNRMMNRFTAIS